MQLYALIHNNQIQVGPRDWNYTFFLDYLEEETLISSTLPRKAPGAAIITAEWKILPITEVVWPDEFNPVFEDPVGPFWTIHDDHITGIYTKRDSDLDGIRGTLKNIVANNRYAVEVGNLEYTFADGEKVGLYTDRETRAIYLQTLTILPDGETASFKFVNGKFRSNVTKSELSEIVTLGMNHIRSVFEWELSKTVEIDLAGDIEALKSIELKHPSQLIVLE
jgi:hypothetical protein